ncbi:hypothetical protein EV207_12160 [Scopulibacillus darangshiensis]|uniref:DUF4064 domain-containing protein n=1 Tax=Scopulibacillus darangshiensis TaxID=442528 RepID=A0A4R2NUI4_9BACL|nr:hypothetical protein [Scopulibacillus darangshiensis]TCP25630.1 hypothetical protein EV207_12160 [Scopulibacillus darangshiensis]
MKVWVAVLSMLGGLFGLASGFMVTVFGSVFGEDAMANSGATVFWLSALAIVLGFLSWKFKKTAGIALLVVAVWGLIANGLFFTVAFIFLFIAGILSFLIRQKQGNEANLAQ